MPTTDYETDYFGWLNEQARAVREGRWSGVDREMLAEEIEDLGKSERRSIVSAFEVLLLHMLKLRYQPERRSASWEATVKVQRMHLDKLLAENHTLRARLPELLADAYAAARIQASGETGLDLSVFPEQCEWPLGQVLGV